MLTFLFLFMGAPQGQGANPLAMWLPIILIFVIVYLLVFRPLAKRREMETIAPAPAATTESQRYKTLLAFGKFFSLIGWIIVIIGGIIFFVGLLSLLGQILAFGGSFPVGPMGLTIGLLVAVYGIILVASGQGIFCFVSIENNTYTTMLTQQAILNMMRGQTQPSPQTTNFQTVEVNTKAPVANAETKIEEPKAF